MDILLNGLGPLINDFSLKPRMGHNLGGAQGTPLPPSPVLMRERTHGSPWTIQSPSIS